MSIIEKIKKIIGNKKAKEDSVKEKMDKKAFKAVLKKMCNITRFY